MTEPRDSALRKPKSSCGLIYDMKLGWRCYLNGPAKDAHENVKHVSASKVRKEARDLRKRCRSIRDEAVKTELLDLANHMDDVANQCDEKIRQKLVPRQALEYMRAIRTAGRA